jgi:hypothetical protein
MKRNWQGIAGAGWLVLLVLGCRRSEEAKVPELGTAFEKAGAEAKAQAAQAAAELNAPDSAGKAFLDFQSLSSRSDLTPEQRAAAMKSMLEAGKKLKEASDKGDTEAGKILDAYRAGK